MILGAILAGGAGERAEQTLATIADGRLLEASGIGTGNTVAKDIRLAEMMIARGTSPDPAALADPATNLKKLL